MNLEHFHEIAYLVDDPDESDGEIIAEKAIGALRAARKLEEQLDGLRRMLGLDVLDTPPQERGEEVRLEIERLQHEVQTLREVMTAARQQGERLIRDGGGKAWVTTVAFAVTLQQTIRSAGPGEVPSTTPWLEEVPRVQAGWVYIAARLLEHFDVDLEAPPCPDDAPSEDELARELHLRRCEAISMCMLPGWAFTWAELQEADRKVRRAEAGDILKVVAVRARRRQPAVVFELTSAIVVRCRR